MSKCWKVKPNAFVNIHSLILSWFLFMSLVIKKGRSSWSDISVLVLHCIMRVHQM